MAAISNFSKTLKKVNFTSPYSAECDCKFLINIFQVLAFLSFTKNLGVDLWGLFWIFVASLNKNPAVLCLVTGFVILNSKDVHLPHVWNKQAWKAH